MVIGTCQQMAAWEQVDVHHHLSRQSERESGEREREREINKYLSSPWKALVIEEFDLFTHASDENGISPYKINTLSRAKVTRRKDDVKQGDIV